MHAVSNARFSFAAKVVAAFALVLVADAFFYEQRAGATIGLFALVWALLVVAVRPAIARQRHALFALAAAMAFALVLVDDPSLLGWTLFWLALSLGTLLPRLGRFDTASLWAARLFLHAFSTPAALPGDALKVSHIRHRTSRVRLRRLVPVLVLPVLGGIVFLSLFAAANPLISSALDALRLPGFSGESILRMFFGLTVAFAVWPMLRPRKWTTGLLAPLEVGDGRIAGVSVASVTISLLLFNLIFAVQNGLDIAFLWSGAPLPEGVTLADYAHRGAYPLIATALLAGLFVLVTLRPGSETAAKPLIRQLVVLWVTQNLLLVASSILRTLDYVDVFSLTRLRIAALAWMVLVALGLILICWRMLNGRSAAWLINSCAACAAAMLSLASVVDLGAVAASWNVVHAKEAGGRGEPLDLCYLRHLGSSALVPLARLERRQLSPELRERARYLRSGLLNELKSRQADWHGWTPRGARRLAATRRLIGDTPPAAMPAEFGRDCHGRPIERPFIEVAPPAPPPPQPPLTQEPRR